VFEVYWCGPTACISFNDIGAGDTASNPILLPRPAANTTTTSGTKELCVTDAVGNVTYTVVSKQGNVTTATVSPAGPTLNNCTILSVTMTGLECGGGRKTGSVVVQAVDSRGNRWGGVAACGTASKTIYFAADAPPPGLQCYGGQMVCKYSDCPPCPECGSQPNCFDATTCYGGTVCPPATCPPCSSLNLCGSQPNCVPCECPQCGTYPNCRDYCPDGSCNDPCPPPTPDCTSCADFCAGGCNPTSQYNAGSCEPCFTPCSVNCPQSFVFEPNAAISGQATGSDCCTGNWSISGAAATAGLTITTSGAFGGSIATSGDYQFTLSRATCGSVSPCDGTGSCTKTCSVTITTDPCAGLQQLTF